jgi:hypothetical protein
MINKFREESIFVYMRNILVEISCATRSLDPLELGVGQLLDMPIKRILSTSKNQRVIHSL